MRPSCMSASITTSRPGTPSSPTTVPLAVSLRVQERPVHMFEVRITVGAIHDRPERSLERNRKTACVNLEIGRIGGAVHLDAIDQDL